MAEGELQRILGSNLRLHRQARGISQESFANALGFHRTYLGSLERGERNLTLRSVERLAHTLGVSPIALLQDRPSDAK